MATINFENLLSSGAHFGHVVRKWHPAYDPFILMKKNGIHIINLDKTILKMEQALSFVRKVVKRNGEFLFVSTKKQAQDIVQQEADRCGMFYVVERWLGGTLTNYSTIKKSIKRLQLLEKEGSGIYDNLTKKEIQMLNRERIKLADQHRGIKDMKRLPDVVVIVDAQHEMTAVREAKLLEIPVIAIVDTNTNPNLVDYPIPANDDSIRAIQLILSVITDEILAVKNPIGEETLEEKENNTTKITSDTSKELLDKKPNKEAKPEMKAKEEANSDNQNGEKAPSPKNLKETKTK